MEKETKDDMLERLFEKQIILQKRLGNYPLTDMKQRQTFINIMMLAALDEMTEAMRETCWKNPNYVVHGWKQTQKFDEVKFKEEIVDLWHFVINLSLAAGFDAKSLFEGYCDKNAINHKRQDNNY